MLDVNIQFDDVNISNMEKNDLVDFKNLVNREINYCEDVEKSFLDIEELKERFLEYYISECEFFLKVYKKEKFVGALKGRVEFKNPNEVWIGCFFLEHNIRNKGLGSKIVDEIKKYFFEEYGAECIFTGVMEKSYNTFRFWKKNNFSLLRVSKGFYDINGEKIDMFILKTKGRM